MKVLFFVILCVFLGGCCGLSKKQGVVSSEWLPSKDFNQYLAVLGEKKDSKNYWDRGHWIERVEGRWQDGRPEYKISYGKVPENKGYWWYWWYNQNQESFTKHVDDLAKKGFILVSHQSFVRPGGEVRYQGVWHKLIEAKQ